MAQKSKQAIKKKTIKIHMWWQKPWMRGQRTREKIQDKTLVKIIQKKTIETADYKGVVRVKGKEKGDKPTLVQVRSSLVTSESVPFLPRDLVLVLTQIQHISMLHLYYSLSLPLRTWIPLLYTAWLGSSSRKGYSNNGVKHHVAQITIHPKSQGWTADMALLKLVSRVTFTSSILSICLPSTTKQLSVPGSCWVTG